jgi:hypothetical protein
LVLARYVGSVTDGGVFAVSKTGAVRKERYKRDKLDAAAKALGGEKK